MAVRGIRSLAIAAGLALALAGCATASDPEEAYLAAVKAGQSTTLTDLALVQIGRAICGVLADGGGAEALNDIAMSSGADATLFRVIAEQAGTHLCTDQRDEIDAALGG